jgi:exonuclease VII small subunit
MTRRISVAVAMIALLVAGHAAAQTLYKLIDKNGKVTYVDTPPKDFDGKVVPVQVDTKRNSATITTPGTREAVRSFDEKAAASDQAAARLKSAQEKLEAAKKNLAFARENPQAGEVARMGNAGGGTRPVPTPDYEKRLAELERSVKDAEDEVKQAQRAAR